jgi:hypothetical protein
MKTLAALLIAIGLIGCSDATPPTASAPPPTPVAPDPTADEFRRVVKVMVDEFNRVGSRFGSALNVIHTEREVNTGAMESALDENLTLLEEIHRDLPSIPRPATAVSDQYYDAVSQFFQTARTIFPALRDLVGVLLDPATTREEKRTAVNEEMNRLDALEKNALAEMLLAKQAFVRAYGLKSD